MLHGLGVCDPRVDRARNTGRAGGPRKSLVSVFGCAFTRGPYLT